MIPSIHEIITEPTPARAALAKAEKKAAKHAPKKKAAAKKARAK